MERVRRAGFLRRAAALSLDCFLIQLACGILTAVAVVAVKEGARASGLPDPSEGSRVILFDTLAGLWIVLPVVYFTFFVAMGGQTPAKMLAGIRVVGRHEEDLSAFRALSRALAYWVSAFPLGIGFLWVFLNGERRAFHDYIAGTRVIRRG